MNSARKNRWSWWWLAPALALALFCLRAGEQAHFKHRVSELEQLGLYPCAADPHSPTGYRWGQHSQILSPDGCHWVMQTEQMLASGSWRVREVSYDNAPAGREVHWSSSMHWWLGALAWLHNIFGAGSTAASVEAVAAYAPPLLFLCAMAALLPLAWRWFGAAAAGCIALGLVLVAPAGNLFDLGDPDHHGLVALSSLLVVLTIQAGLSATIPARARLFFIASGLAAASGLWISAATMVPVLLGVGLGGLASARLQAGSGGLVPVACGARPEFWRWWGVAGAAASVAFYLLEYFPSHFGLRLEVNHPLYALALLGGGELLCCCARPGAGRPFAAPGKDRLLAALAVLAIMTLPLMILVTGRTSFWVSDRTLWSLHANHIIEFASVARRLGDVPPSQWLSVVNPLPLLALAVWWRAYRASPNAPDRARLFALTVPAFVLTALAFLQVRWMGLSCVLWLAVLAVAMPAAGLRAAPAGWKALAAALAFASALPWLSQTAGATRAILHGDKGLSALDLRLAVMRDLAQWLRMRTGDAGAVVLAEPGTTTSLIYHGGIRGVGTLYWENKDGLQATVDMFGATDDATALGLFQRHGVTHVVIVPWDTFMDQLDHLGRSPRSLLSRLLSRRDVPAWLRPVHYPTPPMGGLNDGPVLVYEVVPAMSPGSAALAEAKCLMESGSPLQAAQQLGALLERQPDDLPAWIALAQALIASNRLENFDVAHAAIMARLGQASTLALDDRIGLAAILAISGDRPGSGRQLGAILDTADEAALRRLAPDALLRLVLLARDSGGQTSHPAAMQLINRLLPQYLRARLQAAAAHTP